MGLFDSIKSVFGGSATPAAERETGCVYIVDAEKLADSREGRVGPVERFRAIQQLSRFAEREKVEIIAVVGGRPLREVAHGELFNGVRVFYVEENSVMSDQIEKALNHARGRKTVVITSDKQFEIRLHQRGIDTMRVTTLRKAFEGGDGGSSESGRGRGDRDRRGRRGGRTERARPQDDSTDQSAEQGPSVNAAAAAETTAPTKPQDTVDGLIDRVN